MAAASFATDLQDIITDPTGSTGWSLISSGGGGASSFTAPETDDYVQGTQCISRNPWSSSIRGMVFNSAQTVAAGNAVWMWVKADVAQALAIKASGGIQLLIGSATTALKSWYVDGSDTYTFGGWKCIPIDPTVTESELIGSPTGTTSYFGARWNVPSSGPSKGFPFKIDAIRRGRTLTVTGGDVGNGYATFLATANYQGEITRQWGQLQLQNGTYLMQGRLALGTSGTAVDFRDSNRTIFVANTEYVNAAFNAIELVNASSRLDLTNVSIAALGTVSRGTFAAVNSATINFTNCTFSDMGTFTFDASTNANNITGTTFRRCGKVTGNSATFTSCTFDSTYDTAAVQVANLGKLVGCRFTSDGSSHGVELTVVGTYSWSGIASGYDSGSTGSPVTPTSTGNELIYVTATTGTVTISVDSGATVPSIRSAGATVNVSAGAVTATISVTTALGTAISGAQVYVAAANGTGPLPYLDNVTITNSGTTATVSHTAHGMATGDKVAIKGASHAANRGVFVITVTGANSYTYTMASAPGSDPTGTITATWVAIFGTTDGSGEASLTRTFAGNQPVSGWARKSSASPFYKNGPVSGVINSGTGASLTALLIADE